ncbi:DUF4097 family beta strand repeat-containing protein [Neofamilia massiliensis]|uniref:DUF4097 family beta strand repeat-containing protein n=1 Tax=Neofamilia massiliensis TaxID=1673724 RepID=UPI0006BB64B3|nr:DUF4097 family beta strand repeat-containing protein [Neofamilia massiliensis]
MSDEKKLILKMLQEGKITEDEAITLLDSIKDKKKATRTNTDFDSLINKISETASKIGKKSQEMVSNFDFEDFTNMFTVTDQKNKAERLASENIIGLEEPSLYVENQSGKIKIYSWDNEEIQVTADVSYDDRFIADTYDFISIRREDDKVYIEPNYDSVSGRYFSINLSIALPEKHFKEISLKSTNANLEIEDVKADSLLVKTINAKISGKNIEAKEGEVSSTNARISLENLSGDKLQIKTTNGKIDIKDIDYLDLEMKTTNGSLVVANLGARTESIYAKTSNGNISIALKNIFKPIKAKMKNNFKGLEASYFADSIFTNFVTEDKVMVAYTDGYDENADRLDIEATTTMGNINIK